MNKKVGIIKRMLCLCLVFLLSINSFAAIVSDNDGSAFITKAEFDALKSSFQSQIDSYNQSIDSKIDGAIASYLAGIRLSTTQDLDYSWTKYLNVKRTTSAGEAEFAWDLRGKPYNPYQDLSLTLAGPLMFSNSMANDGSYGYGDPNLAGIFCSPKLKPTLQIDNNGIVTELNNYATVMDNMSWKWLGSYLSDSGWTSTPMLLHAGLQNTGTLSAQYGIIKITGHDLSKIRILQNVRSGGNGEVQYAAFNEQTSDLSPGVTLNMNPIGNSLEWTNRMGDMICSWTNVRAGRLNDFVQTIDFADVGLSSTYNTPALKHSMMNYYGIKNNGTSDGASAYTARTTNAKGGHGQWHAGRMLENFKYSSSATVNGKNLWFIVQIASGAFFNDGITWDTFPYKSELSVTSDGSLWGNSSKNAESVSSAALVIKNFWNCDIAPIKDNTNIINSTAYTIRDYFTNEAALLTDHRSLRFFYPYPDSWLVKDNAISYKQKNVKYQTSGLKNNSFIVPSGGLPIAQVPQNGNLTFTLKNNGSKDIYIFAYSDNTQDTLWGKTRSVPSLSIRNDTWDSDEFSNLNSWLISVGGDTNLKIGAGGSKTFTLSDVKKDDYLWVGVLCKDAVVCDVDIEEVVLQIES